ncbi:hypothetical protein ACRRTK_007343 [Alexandromys fortis]
MAAPAICAGLCTSPRTRERQLSDPSLRTASGQKRASDHISDGCEPPCGCRELNPGPLEEQVTRTEYCTSLLTVSIRTSSNHATWRHREGDTHRSLCARYYMELLYLTFFFF